MCAETSGQFCSESSGSLFVFLFVVLQSPPPGQNVPSLGSPGVGSRNRGLLLDGDIEGVRQLNVNIPIIQDATEADINAWRNRVIVPKLKESEAKYVRFK